VTDWRGIRIGTIEQDEGRIALHGEFDLSNREALRGVLGAAHRQGHGTLIDLSGVTFVDVGCAKELAFWRLLGLELPVTVDPSWQAALILAACGLTEPSNIPNS
jgi:anti-anti-sigma regulatory factor